MFILIDMSVEFEEEYEFNFPDFLINFKFVIPIIVVAVALYYFFTYIPMFGVSLDLVYKYILIFSLPLCIIGFLLGLGKYGEVFYISASAFPLIIIVFFLMIMLSTPTYITRGKYSGSITIAGSVGGDIWKTGDTYRFGGEWSGSGIEQGTFEGYSYVKPRDIDSITNVFLPIALTLIGLLAIYCIAFYIGYKIIEIL